MSLVSQPSEAQQDQDEVKLLYMFLDFHNPTNILIFALILLQLLRSAEVQQDQDWLLRCHQKIISCANL